MKKQSNSRSKTTKKAAANSMRIALENRLLFDGAVVATATQALEDQASAPDHNPDAGQDDAALDIGKIPAALSAFIGGDSHEKSNIDQPPAIPVAMSAGDPGATTLIVVDSRSEGVQDLLAYPPTGSEIVVLDANKDGYQQIAQLLQYRDSTTELHILSATVGGKQWLGSSQFTSNLTTSNSEALIDWGDSLAGKAQITFHGEQAVAGASWLNHVQALTGGQVSWAYDKALQAVKANTSDSSVDPEEADKTVLPLHPEHQAPTSLVFIDAGVNDYQTLLNNIDPNATVIFLDHNKDGVEQIAEAVSNYDNISAIHIISHGQDGELYLGNGVLNLAGMQGKYSDELQDIGKHLSKNADILIYGCDFGQGLLGKVATARLAQMTGADIADSIDQTGSAALGGNWVLENQYGTIETKSINATDWNGLLATTVNNGKGAFVAALGRSLYSINFTSGKATLITTLPPGFANGATSLNSLAVDQVNGLIYYTEATQVGTNVALYAYDFISNNHIVIDSNLTNNGVGKSIIVNTTSTFTGGGPGFGVGGGGATFANNTLFLGVENNVNATGAAGTTNDTIYAITFTGAGKVIDAILSKVTVAATANDWGDIGYDGATNSLQNMSAGTSMTRYDAATGVALTSGTINTLPGNTANGTQAAEDFFGVNYRVGGATGTIQRFDPVTGNNIGAAVNITTNGSATLANITDGTAWIPPKDSQIGDKVFDDNNNNATFDAGDTGIAGITLELIEDMNNNGVVDAADTVVATDITDALGNYLFTGVLPGTYIVRVSDPSAILGTSPSTTGGATKAVTLSTVGAKNLLIDFGYNAIAPIVDLNSGATTQELITNGNFSAGSAGWVSSGGWNLPGGNAFISTDTGTFTLTQSNIAGWDSGNAVTGSVQLSTSILWGNGSGGTSPASTLDISVGGTLYARVTTVTGTGTVGAVAYFNGATGNLSTITAATATTLLVDLPSNVASTGNLVYRFTGGGVGGDDFFIDNVSAIHLADLSPGNNFSTVYGAGGSPVSIADTDNTVRDADSTTMVSGVVTLTNPQAGDILLVNGSTAPTGTLAGGITYTLTATSVTFTGVASEADYASAIRAVQFQNILGTPSLTPRILNTTVNDGISNSNIAITTIQISADTDLDGIANINDIDDDNDGILDTTEGALTSSGAIQWLHNDSGGTSLAGAADASISSSVTTVSNISFGGGFTTPTSTFEHVLQGANSSTFAQAITNNDYVQVSFTLSNLATLESLQHSLVTLADGASAAGNYNTAALISSDGFTTSTQLYDNGFMPGPTTGYVRVTNPTNSLVLEPGVSYTIRVYLFNESNSILPNGTVAFDDFLLNFNVVKDTDKDGVQDSLDLDSDNDGISDLYESTGGIGDATADSNNDGTVSLAESLIAFPGGADGDIDNDGLMDVFDTTPNTGAAGSVGNNPINTDSGTPTGDATPDYLDLDSDGDGIADTVEARPTAGYVTFTGTVDTNDDLDNDGVIDIFDSSNGVGGAFGGNFTPPVNTDDTFPNADTTPDYLDEDSDGDGISDFTEKGTIATPPTYTDPDGSVNNPQLNLANEYGDTSEVGYREIAPIVTAISSPTVAEGNNLDFTVLILPSNSPTTVTLTPTSGTATLGTDTGAMLVSFDGGASFVPVVGTTVTVPVGAISFIVRIPALIDTVLEVSETITLAASTAQNVTIPSGTGTITNTTALTVSISDAATVNEGGDLVYTVTLSGTSTTDITVPVTYTGTA
ncbi:MAG: DUF4347 domain-containing protein, partial [Methyloglobulus sp.]